MKFYDAHSHCLENQSGGFLIGLDGEPHFQGTLYSSEVLKLENKKNDLYAVEYISSVFNNTTTQIVKYHPRREKYSPQQVVDDIKKREFKIAIIDTLNQPYWQPMDYWNIALQFPNIQFLFCHAGGYDIHEFIKMATFQENIWIDFSLTQEYFGWCGNRVEYKLVTNAIDFALQNKILQKKILFGSDNVFFSQAVALEKYLSLKDSNLFLKDNFVDLIKKAQIS